MTISIRRILVTAGAVLLLGLAAIGLVEASSARPTPAAPLANVPANEAAVATADSDTALAGELDAILAADQTAGQPAAAAARDNTAAGALRRIRLGRHLVHGTVVLDLPEKGITTIQLDHGTIKAVSTTSVTITEAGGTTATVTLGDKTRVRRDGAKAKVGDLKTGDEVFVMSKVESTGTIAYLVIVPKA